MKFSFLGLYLSIKALSLQVPSFIDFMCAHARFLFMLAIFPLALIMRPCNCQLCSMYLRRNSYENE